MLRHFWPSCIDVRGLIEWGGTVGVCAIVFVETGMFVGFFLPGDSLLVTAGVFAGAGHIKLASLLILVHAVRDRGRPAGLLRRLEGGTSSYERKDSRFFKKKHLERAHEFYETYGGKTIILARFVPIIRTFCPPVAGAAKMNYGRYLALRHRRRIALGLGHGPAGIHARPDGSKYR